MTNQDQNIVKQAYSTWMCFEAASRGYKFQEAKAARDQYEQLAREYREKHGKAWDAPTAQERKAAATREYNLTPIGSEEEREAWSAMYDAIYEVQSEAILAKA